jgi:CDP-diacylglycerol--glycerol-3-phosphate 3-phosphatidyltransferase
MDVAASIALITALALALGAHLVSSLAAGRALVADRVEREAALPVVGKAPMHAVYRALVPLGRLLAALGVSANAISVSSVAIAALAAVAFATGHFGVGALIAAVSALADGLDGMVARLTETRSRFGQVLDTTIDRYVDALFLGGIAVFVRSDVWLLVVTLGAIVGSFMVSYASSVERELAVPSTPVAMRRAHRLAYLLVAVTIAPLAGRALAEWTARGELVPIFAATLAIAIVGNVSAVRRLLASARVASSRDDEPASGPDVADDARVPAGETPR